MPETATVRQIHHPDILLGPGDYWACQRPEAPHDEYTAYDQDCEWCVVKARMAAANGHGDDVGIESGSRLPVGLYAWLKANGFA